MAEVKMIIFDWDDVFTKGSTKGYLECYHHALTDLGVHLDPEVERQRIENKWGQSHREELKELLQENPELLDEACKIYESHLYGDTFVNALSMMPGSIELVERLAKKYVLTVATGVDSKILNERVLPKFGFPDVFVQVVSAYDIEDPSMAKPHPHMAELILEKQGILAEKTVLVGDAKNDMLLAMAVGSTPIATLSGHMSQQDAEELGIEYIIPDVTHLEGVLKTIESNNTEK